jgi:hypothetical protein
MNHSFRTFATQDISLLLQEGGIHKTWYSLLATLTHAQNRHDLHHLTTLLTEAGGVLLPKNYLHDLSVGEISALYEFSLAFIDKTKRKESGQYFTPDDVASCMADRMRTFPDGVWLDPCAGVGNLTFWLAKKTDDPETFLEKHMILVDKDELALFIARCLLTISFQKNNPNLFSTLAHRCVVADFLEEKELPRYDFAILNPPYVMVPKDSRFITAEARELYAYFLEKVLLTTKGFISITPQTFTHAKKFFSFRKLLLEKFSHITLYCFDNVPDAIFRGIKFGSENTNKTNSTRASIMVAHPTKEKRFRITPLLRWRVHERADLLHNLDTFLVETTPRMSVFPKLHPSLSPLYSLLTSTPYTPLATLVAPSPTPYLLLVPSTPRYFISALKTPVARTSLKTLYFKTAEERDIAYLLINSSYMYWWWRVHDGGMTISDKVLVGLPIPNNARLEPDLIKKLEKSEQTNRVSKKNAGKENENVKHDPALIREITMVLFPTYAQELEQTHANSVLTHGYKKTHTVPTE